MKYLTNIILVREEIVMYHVSHLSKKERMARSRLKKLINSSPPFIRGNVATHVRSCGKQSCKCYRGEKHVSLYLVYWEDKKQKRIFIPVNLEETIKKWVNNYKLIEGLLQEISKECYRQFICKKAKRRSQ